MTSIIFINKLKSNGWNPKKVLRIKDITAEFRKLTAQFERDAIDAVLHDDLNLIPEILLQNTDSQGSPNIGHNSSN